LQPAEVAYQTRPDVRATIAALFFNPGEYLSSIRSGAIVALMSAPLLRKPCRLEAGGAHRNIWFFESNKEDNHETPFEPLSGRA
jgi:hypothetical protein